MPPKVPKGRDVKKYVQKTLFDSFSPAQRPKEGATTTKPSSAATNSAYQNSVNASIQSKSIPSFPSPHPFPATSPYFASTSTALPASDGNAQTDAVQLTPKQSISNQEEMQGVESTTLSPLDTPPLVASLLLPPETSTMQRQGSENHPAIQGYRSNEKFAQVAAENIEMLDQLVSVLFGGQQNVEGTLHTYGRTGRIGRTFCPRFTLPSYDPRAGRPGCRIRVIDSDSFDAACTVLEDAKLAGVTLDKPPLVMNMANQFVRGGGWRKGAMAQEEELCYRSTLYSTLRRSYYPLPDNGGIHSPSVAIFRTKCVDGHQLYDMASYILDMQAGSVPPGPPPDHPLPVVSVVSVAAVRNPEIDQTVDPPGYANPGDQRRMEETIRFTLRLAARQGHRHLVLGALGCGAFHNPNQEVARIYKQVLTEYEFSGGWWEQIVFAVLDTSRQPHERGTTGSGNFGVFFRELDGLIV